MASDREQQIDLQLKALADCNRRRILELLKARGDSSCPEARDRQSGLCVSDLEKHLGLTQPTITHHLQVLRQAGLIRTRKIGRWVCCSRREDALDRLSGWVRRL